MLRFKNLINVKYVWSEETENGFNKIKAILISEPVLIAPDFQKQFKLAIDAGDIGCGLVLMEVGEDGIDHPISYFSRSLISTKEITPLLKRSALLSFWHWSILIGGHAPYTQCLSSQITIPITFIDRMKNKNQRLVRWSFYLAGI